MLVASAERYGDRVALDFFGAETTYTELLEEVGRAAEALRAAGVRAGDRVALVLPNCPQHVVAFYASLRLGAVVVEHNPLYTATELEHQLADCGAKVVVCWDRTAPMIDGLRGRTAVQVILAVDLTSALPWRMRLALRLPVAKARAAPRLDDRSSAAGSPCLGAGRILDRSAGRGIRAAGPGGRRVAAVHGRDHRDAQGGNPDP